MRIGIIMGGVSSEREISLQTGNEIIKHLDSKYDTYPILLNTKNDLFDSIKNIDFAFIALHGTFGEDGTVQGVLDTLNIPYSGCNLLTSSLCMNKNITKKILAYDEINTPDWIMIQSTSDIPLIEKKFGYPVVVKPNSNGSSIGISIVYNNKALFIAIKNALAYDSKVIIEQYINGQEITCCILGNTLLPILEIKPKNNYFFDYSSKYDDYGADENIVTFDDLLFKKIKFIALKCYEIMECKIYARIDMIIKNNVPYVLEINTLPGLTKNSLFPKSAKAAGISYSKLLDKIITLSYNTFI